MIFPELHDHLLCNCFCVDFFHQVSDEFIEGFYVVQTDETFVVAATTYPVEMDEGYGEYFRRVIWSIEFAGSGLVRAQWADDIPDRLTTCDEISTNPAEKQVRVAFYTDGVATEFKVLALTFEGIDDAGNVIFDVEEVYSQAELTAERPLVVGMTFYGDIPNNGISYVDASGKLWRFAVDISGEDGSLLLWEF